MILLASCYYQKNYGSKLQAYATQAVLDELGIENKTINCDLLNKYLNRRKIRYYFSNIQNVDAFLAQIQRYIFRFEILKRSGLSAQIKLRNDCFEEFINKNFRLTAPYHFHELAQMVVDCSANTVIVGSDQLWLPSNIYADYYTLNWVPDKIKRISCATSFGVRRLDKKTSDAAKIFLSKFDAISVREKQGKMITDKLTGKLVTQICDPVMFFNANEWINLLNIEKCMMEPYIFCYFLGGNAWHRKWAKLLKEVTGLKIVALICLEKYIKSDFDFADETPFDVDPARFVSLIANATYVCTDSFHGTSFSILFRKQFFSFRRFNESNSASTNNRLDSLLELFQLKGRLVHNKVSPAYLIEHPIKYEDVDKSIENYRKMSLDWLKTSLEEN